MTSSGRPPRQAHRLLQVSVALFLFSSLEGFAIQHLAAPRLGLAVHTLSAFEGVLLIALGLMWPRLRLVAMTERIAFWLLLYSNFAILAAYLIAAVLGAGNETMPLAAGPAHGSTAQEAAIKYVAYHPLPRGSSRLGSFCGVFVSPTPRASIREFDDDSVHGDV